MFNLNIIPQQTPPVQEGWYIIKQTNHSETEVIRIKNTLDGPAAFQVGSDYPIPFYKINNWKFLFKLVC